MIEQREAKGCQTMRATSSSQTNDQHQSPSSNNNKLINEALKRILLDIVIRGHGDRLIGRWSADLELQKFLDQVPYLLDRINQLHLACTRSEHLDIEHVHHHHHHQHHHNHKSSTLRHNLSSSRLHHHQRPTALSDFMHLIGNEMHWLVRTRDPLGLSPLHKAVLYNNRPIVEYIVDRYQNEFAAMHNNQSKTGGGGQPLLTNRPLPRLIDAQDKYGRTALHYAAALVNQKQTEVADAGGNNHQVANYHLYHYLISKKASQEIEDFRGKRPAYYLANPERLLIKSIIYLDNKLNASFQANVLTKTLKATQERAIRLRELELNLLDNDQEADDRLGSSSRNSNRFPEARLISGSCNELRVVEIDAGNQHPNHHLKQDKDNIFDIEENFDFRRSKSSSNLVSKRSRSGCGRTSKRDSSISLQNQSLNETNVVSITHHGNEDEIKKSMKNLLAERINRAPCRLPRSKRQEIIRSVQEADFDRLNEFLIEGYGDFLANGDLLSFCWNQQCKRYLLQFIPEILEKVDALHEAIVRDQVELVNEMLLDEPILARIRRPYKRASMNSLHMAIQYERLPIIYQLIENYPELINQRDSNGATCLHYAGRSLHLDRLYCWLLEHFGPQLEQTRDQKGRSASDYRHHAIRLASLNSLSGSREQHQQNDNNANCLQPASRLASNTPTPASNDPQMALQFGVGDAADEQLTISGSALELKSRPIGAHHHHHHQRKSNLKIFKLGQDDSLINSPTRQQKQASNNLPKRLETTIIECIKNEDTKTLEHLILANCGQRIEETYARLLRANKLGQISDEMREFIENHTPAYRQTIERVHQILHCCFAFRRDNLMMMTTNLNQNLQTQPAEYNQDTIDEEADSQYVPDMQFLRLNNLLADKRLVMSRDQFGASPLHVSMLRADNRLIEFLLRRQPEAASAPDLNCRTAFHYAAIVCATFKRHGPFKLTINKTTINDQDDNFGDGYWLIDSTIEQIYQKFLDRYSNLLSVCDKLGKKPEDYLVSSNDDDKLKHIDLRTLPVGLNEPKECLGCCSDYANLLTRYNYLILTERPSLSPIQKLEASASKSNHSGNQQPDKHARDNSIETVNQNLTAQSVDNFQNADLMQALPMMINDDDDKCSSEPKNDVERIDSDRESAGLNYEKQKKVRNKTEDCIERSGSFDTTTVGCQSSQNHASSASRKNRKPILSEDTTLTSTNSSPRGIKPRLGAQSATNISTGGGNKPTINKNRSRNSANDLLGSLEGDLWVPGESSDLRPPITQVAPKPTVGSEAGFPLFSRSPTNLTGLKCDPGSVALNNNNVQKKTTSKMSYKNENQSKRNQQQGIISSRNGKNSVSVGLPSKPNHEVSQMANHYVENIDNNALDYGLYSTQQNRYRSKRLVHNNGIAHKRGSASGSSSYYHKSVVGGVIVPSIIHDEKSGEIETYDIIYRQPSPRPSSASSSATGAGGGRNCLSSKSHLIGSGATNHHHHNPHRRHSNQNRVRSGSSSSGSSGCNGQLKTIGNTRRRASNNDSEPASNESETSEPEDQQQQFEDLSTTMSNSFQPIQESDDDDGGGGNQHLGENKTRLVEENSSQSSMTDDDDLSNEDDDEDYDDRVERLSNEFDLRVTREKNELRAKVDQIMSEIRINTRSISPVKNPPLATTPDVRLQSPRPSSSSTINSSNLSYSTTTSTSTTSNNSSTTTSSGGVGQKQSTLNEPKKQHQHQRPSSATGSATSVSRLSSAKSMKDSTPTRSPSPSKTVDALQKQMVSIITTGDRADKSGSSTALPVSNNKPPAAIYKHHDQQHPISKNAYGQTYLHFIASQAQDGLTLYKILDHAPHLISERDAFYRTARDVGVQFNLPENVMIIDEFIIDAFISARTSLLKHLLIQGYSPLIHVSDPDGNDIMLILKLLKLDKMIQLLLQMADFQRWRDELHSFIRHGYSAGVHELVRKHQDLVRSKSVHSRTSLHLAVLFDRHDILDVLIKRDPACVFETDCMGRTALHYAYALRSQNMARIRQKLIDHRADQEARDVKMRMPKYYSIFTGEIEDIKRIESELN